jgi:transcriptional regulator with XRE-family HTH domain
MRKYNRMSQKELASRTGLSAATISRYENNIRIYSWETLKRIALGLETNADYLLGITDVKLPTRTLISLNRKDKSDWELLEKFAKLEPAKQTALLEAAAYLDIFQKQSPSPGDEPNSDNEAT